MSKITREHRDRWRRARAYVKYDALEMCLDALDAADALAESTATAVLMSEAKGRNVIVPGDLWNEIVRRAVAYRALVEPAPHPTREAAG